MVVVPHLQLSHSEEQIKHHLWKGAHESLPKIEHLILQVKADYDNVVFRSVGTTVTFFFSFFWSNIQENTTQTLIFPGIYSSKRTYFISESF